MTTTLAGNDVATMRLINSQALLRWLYLQRVPLTIADLARHLELSRPTVEATLGELIAGRLVRESPTPTGAARMGRPARRYEFAAEHGLVMGLHAGPDDIRLITTDLRGDTLDQDSVALSPSPSAAEALDAMNLLIRGASSRLGRPTADIAAIAVGVPAIVDLSGEIALSTVVPQWQRAGFAAELGATHGGPPVLVDNDVKLSTLAEIEWGSAGGIEHVVHLSVTQRIGVGLIVQGRLLRGTHGAAGEIGALPRLGWVDSPQRMAALDSGARSAREIFLAAGEGDPAAVRLVEDFAESIADGVIALCLTTDPELIIIGGDAACAGRALTEPLRRAVNRTTLAPVEITASSIERDAVALGAIARGLEAFRADAMPLADL